MTIINTYLTFEDDCFIRAIHGLRNNKTYSVLLALLLMLLAGCGGANLVDKAIVDKIILEGKEFEIHVFGYDSTETTSFFHHQRIEIKVSEDADPIQAITTNLESSSQLDSNGNIVGFVADYNFDGFDDFRLSSGESYFGIEPYSMWLYDPKSKEYIYHDFLESAAAFDLDNEKMQITMIHGRGDDMTTFTYKYQDGRYYSVKEVAEVYNYEYDIRTVTTSELISGEMKQTDLKKFRVLEYGEAEIKKSGQVKGQQELANFLRMIDGRKGALRTIKIVDGEHLRWNDSCVNPGFNIVKYPEEEYEFDEFNLDVYPLLIWVFDGVENYSIRRITYRNYGNDFNMVVRYVEPFYDNETNELGEENYWYRWTYDAEKGYWLFFEDLSPYGQDGEKPYVLESILASLEMSEIICDEDMY